MWGSPFQKCTEARKKGFLRYLVVVGDLVDCEEMNIIYNLYTRIEVLVQDPIFYA